MMFKHSKKLKNSIWYLKTYRATHEVNGVFEWVLIEENTELQKRLETKNAIRVEYGVWFNEKFGTYQNYEVFLPLNFSPTKYYPVLLEVYAGPEFQKVQETFKTSWPQVHFPAAYEAITVSVDGRGSAYQGNVLILNLFYSYFLLWNQLSQYSKLDNSIETLKTRR